jgi:hypothetical protein
MADLLLRDAELRGNVALGVPEHPEFAHADQFPIAL